LILKMEILYTSKTLVIIYHSQWCNISCDLTLHQHLHENLKPHRNSLFQNHSKDRHVKYITLCL
jgi:hypothetical protein